MRIKVNPIGVIEEMIKEREFCLPHERISLENFFIFLVRRYGGNLKEHLLPHGSLSSQYFILINGRNSKLLEGFKTQLKDGDEILICPVLTGG
jgi:molybdopterin converting factor small subunit